MGYSLKNTTASAIFTFFPCHSKKCKHWLDFNGVFIFFPLLHVIQSFMLTRYCPAFHYARLLKHAVTAPCLPTLFLKFSLALHCSPFIFVTLCWTCFSMFVSLAPGSPKLDIILFKMGPPPVMSRGKGSRSSTCWQYFACCSPGCHRLPLPHGNIAGLWSTWCPAGPFLPSCFLARWPPAYTGAWSCSSPGAGLCTSPGWTSGGSCQPICPACQGPFGWQPTLDFVPLASN